MIIFGIYIIAVTKLVILKRALIIMRVLILAILISAQVTS